jgi:hypothetical protein
MNIQAIGSLNNVSSTGSASRNSASSSSSSAATSATYDVKDLNKDGYVSAQEELIYAMMHPGEASSQTLLTKYNSQGTVSTTGSGTSNFIDIYA